MTKILAFSGSSSSKSINQQVVHMAAGLFDGDVIVIDIRDYPMPIYSMDIEEGDGFPENAQKLKDLFSEHDGFLISCPEHNGSMPAIFKNMIDWVSRTGGKVFQEKPVLLLSASPGKRGGRTNLDTLTNLVPWWGGKVVASVNIGDFYNIFDASEKKLTDAQLMEEVSQGVKALQGAV